VDVNGPDLGQYCRAVETHLCQVNGGHLVRIVGPAFELVKQWHAGGVPLKIVLRGVERRAERARRASHGSRRPLRLEFCEADVRDVFDEWRRAIGFAIGRADPADEDERAPDRATRLAGEEDGAEPGARRGPSLPKHLERVATRLTSFLLATPGAGPELRGRVESALARVDAIRRAGLLRGDARAEAVRTLEALDAAFLEHLPAEAPARLVEDAKVEARQELAAYESRMPRAEFDRIVVRAAQRLLRSRLQLPELRLQ
jgi:hypothetical protein